MCPPLLALIPAGIGAAGTILSGQAQSAQAKAQAAAYDRQALMTRQQGEYQAQRKQEEIDRTTAQQIADVASSGFTFDGSPSDVIGSTASTGALDTSAIRRSANIQAADLTYQGQLSRINGKNALTGSILGAAGGILGGLSKLGNSFGKQDP